MLKSPTFGHREPVQAVPVPPDTSPPPFEHHPTLAHIRLLQSQLVLS